MAPHRENESGIPTFWGKSGRMLQVLITIVATTDFLLFGYDQGVMSGIVSAPAFVAAFPQVDGDPTYEGFVVAIYAVGCFLGACFIFAFGDRLGRRNSIFLGASVMIVGVIIQVTAVPPNGGATAQFIIGRCITGIGNGINTSTIPTYQAECCRAKNRGKVICIEGGNVAIGTLIAYWIDYGCLYGPDDFTWRFPIAFQCVFAVIVLIMMTQLPESPRWLLTHHREEEAATVMAALNGLRREDPEVLVQMGIIKDAIRLSGGGGKTKFSAVLTNGKSQHLRRAVLGASSQFMQQLSGCNAVIYYFPILCTDIFGDKNLALLLGGVNMIVYAIFATSSWFLIERVGRRKLLLIGTAGQMLSMFLTMGFLIPGGNDPGTNSPQISKGAIAGLFTYIASFGATWLPLPWLYPAEINPLKTRGKANATSTCTNWLFNFVIVMIVPIMIANIHWGTYLFFGCANATFFPILYWFYPETANRSLEEIDIIFAKGFVEQISYVKAAKELPFLSHEEVEREAIRLGLVDEASRGGMMEKPNEESGTVRDESGFNSEKS